MERKYDVFISYRREGGDKYARAIQLELEKKYHVFLDFDELKDGVFDKRITDAIHEAPIFLLVLSRGALDRCVNEDDWVRKEILYAAECNSHIVPVVIVDDAFEGIPSDLPEDLKRLVGSHQFSELQMQSLFKVSMDELIRHRIAPFVQQQEEQSGTEIHIETDAPCRMLCFNKFVKDLKPGIDNIISLNPGTYKISFVSTQYSEIKDNRIYTLTPGSFSDILEVNLKEMIEERNKLEEREKKILEPVVLGRKYGFVDKDGKLVIPPKWRCAHDFYDGLVLVENDYGKWGFIDEQGNEVIPCKWSEASEFSDGLSRVKEVWRGGEGFINKEGKIVIPCQIKKVRDFHEGMASTYSSKASRWGYIDKTGKLAIPYVWYEAHDFSDGLAYVSNETKQGYIDKTGKLVITSVWYEHDSFHNGLARVADYKHWGMIDKSGKLVIPCKWKDIGLFREGLIAVQDSNGKWGYINKVGILVIACQWKDARDFNDGLAAVKDDNDKWGFIDKNGVLVINCQWMMAENFSNGIAHVYKEIWMDCDIIDKKGHIIKKDNTLDRKLNIEILRYKEYNELRVKEKNDDQLFKIKINKNKK